MQRQQRSHPPTPHAAAASTSSAPLSCAPGPAPAPRGRAPPARRGAARCQRRLWFGGEGNTGRGSVSGALRGKARRDRTARRAGQQQGKAGQGGRRTLAQLERALDGRASVAICVDAAVVGAHAALHLARGALRLHGGIQFALQLLSIVVREGGGVAGGEGRRRCSVSRRWQRSAAERTAAACPPLLPACSASTGAHLRRVQRDADLLVPDSVRLAAPAQRAGGRRLPGRRGGTVARGGRVSNGGDKGDSELSGHSHRCCSC